MASKQWWYVGVDVSKDELVVAMADLRPRTFTADRRGISRLLCWVRRQAAELPVHLCMESTGVYSQRPALRLLREGMTVSLVNPAQIAAFAKAQSRRAKTDAIDAQIILAFAQSQQPPPWQPAPEHLQHLAALVNERDALQRLFRQVANRKHTHPYRNIVPPEVRASTATVLRCLTRHLQRLEQALTVLCTQNTDLAQKTALLCTIPGVSHTTARSVLAYGQTLLLAGSARQLTAFAGLAPRIRQSGSSIRGPAHLAKDGHRRLRTALYMPTVCGIRHNPFIKKHYQNLIAHGKPKPVALAACMRKLLILCQAVLRHNAPFEAQLKT
jgi:transposase